MVRYQAIKLSAMLRVLTIRIDLSPRDPEHTMPLDTNRLRALAWRCGGGRRAGQRRLTPGFLVITAGGR